MAEQFTRLIMIKIWTDDAWEEFEYWSTNDKKTLKKILNLLKILIEMDILALENLNH